jgi:hypothetical protein
VQHAYDPEGNIFTMVQRAGAKSAESVAGLAKPKA